MASNQFCQTINSFNLPCFVMLLSGDALRASVVCEDGQSVAETWSRLRDTFDIFECKNNFATAGKDPDPIKNWWTERPPDMLINGVLKVDGCMPVRFEVQVHHKDILERKEKQSHLLYEIQRAASVREVRGSGGGGGGGAEEGGSSSTQLQAKIDEALKKKDEEQQLVLNEKDERLKALEAKLASYEKRSPSTTSSRRTASRSSSSRPTTKKGPSRRPSHQEQQAKGGGGGGSQRPNTPSLRPKGQRSAKERKAGAKKSKAPPLGSKI